MTRYKSLAALIVTFILGLSLSFPATAKLYKWVDDNGTTHYGETIPPEYANKDREELNKAGRVVNTMEVMTPERRLAKQQEDAKKREAELAAQEQKRHDRTLLNTYSSVEEIDLARQRSMQQVDARINFLNSSVDSAQSRIISLQKEADNYTTRNRKIPNSLSDDLQEAQERLSKLQQDLEKPVAAKAELNARFDADKARYMALTGKK
jgi:predicted  nucleic acid-binding Zn-ribbon protein